MKKTLAVLLCAGTLAGCQMTSGPATNLNTYEPAVDYKTAGKSHSQYQEDLYECRKIAFGVQARYEREAAKEQEQRVANAFVGALVGAAVGRAVAGSNNPYRRQYTGAGAIAGASGGIAGSPNNYSHVMRTRGVAGVVDNCLNGRGYPTLNQFGL